MTTEDLENLGNLITSKMEALEINAADLEQTTGISRQYIGEIKNGFKKRMASSGRKPKDIGPGVLLSLARALEIPAYEIFKAAGYDIKHFDQKYEVQSRALEDEKYYIIRIRKDAVPLTDFFKLHRTIELSVKGSQFEQAQEVIQAAQRAGSASSVNAPFVPEEFVKFLNKLNTGVTNSD